MNKINIPIECKLTDARTQDRLVSWGSIQDEVSSVVRLNNGISAKISVKATQSLRDFAAAESECCPSMKFEINESGEELGFRITSEKVDTVQAIHSRFSVGGN